MKKTVTLVLALLLALGLTTGCGSLIIPAGDGSQNNSGSTQSAQPGQETENMPDPDVAKEGDEPEEEEPGEKLAAAYMDIFAGGTYYMKYRTETNLGGQKTESVTEIAIDGNDAALKAKEDDIGSTIIIKGGKMYAISHESKTAFVSTAPPSQGSSLLSQGRFSYSDYAYTGRGVAELFGVSYNYEDYAAGENTVRFFFNDSELAGMESTTDGLIMQIKILELSTATPSFMFDIPDEYTVIEQ